MTHLFFAKEGNLVLKLHLTLKINLNTETSFTINNYLCNQYDIKQQNNTHLTILEYKYLW